MTYVEINDKRYIATIGGRMHDNSWDGRESKYIRAEITYEEAIKNFIDGANWKIIQEFEENVIEKNKVGQETVKTVKKEDVFDNSDYNMAGEIIDHRDGTVTIKMGKPNELEIAMKTIDDILIAMEV
jgi:hypothetical protein